MNKEQAERLLHTHLQNEVLKKHCLASAAIMRGLAVRFGEDPEPWEVLGLLHDLDFDTTRDTPERHGVVAAEILRAAGLAEEHVRAIVAHNEMTGTVRQSRLEFALAAAESITGLIVACALVYPDKKISSVKASSIKKRMKEKAFARNVCRETILECERAGVPFDEFVDLSLRAMAEIQDRLL
jgi:uncharacterized protein